MILIFIGGVLLLENTGYLPPNFWMNLWRLWPLVLVLVGVELLLAGRIPWLVLAGVAALVLIVGAVVTRPAQPVAQSGAGAYTPSTRVTDLGGASQAAVTIRYGAGQLNIGPIDQPTPNELASMSYTGPAEMAPQPAYSQTSDGVGQLEYQSSGHGPATFPNFPWGGGASNPGTARMDLNLAPGVPITSLAVQTGATDARLDLSSLRISTMDLSIGAATAWVRFPAAAGVTTAHISGGASTITLEVPQGVAAQIQHHGGLTTLNVDQARFPQVDDTTFRSPDFDTNPNRLDLSIDTGVTTIQVN